MYSENHLIFRVGEQLILCNWHLQSFKTRLWQSNIVNVQNNVGVYAFNQILLLFDMKRAFTVHCETVGSSAVLCNYLETIGLVSIIANHLDPSVNLPFLTAKTQQEVTG